MARPKIVALQLQDRDLALLRGLFECRVMTADHIATLYFEGKLSYTVKRLQKLKAAGFIGERKRNANEKSILFLTRKSFVLLASQGQLEEYPALGKNTFEARANVSERTLRHELEIMDVKAVFHANLAQSKKFSILKFSTWPRLYEFNVARNGYALDVPVKPDGFTNVPAWLQYNIIETNDAATNLTFFEGSVELWFLPDWNSGTGPGDWGRLIDVGAYSTNAPSSWWSLYFNPDGSSLYFSGETNGVLTNYLNYRMRTIMFSANRASGRTT